ncbi:MAG TPA: hypothetical protein VL404_01185 [Candidatus Eisenbacteria bacterium]|nr:hypothetical protein [Candidatus Eisenbacteria bacterium]
MRKALFFFIAGLLISQAAWAAGAQTIAGHVIGLDIIRKAIYVSHENSGEERGDNKFVWDDQVPGREYLESSSIGDEIRFEAERREGDWKVTRVPAPAKAEAPFDPQFSTLPPSVVPPAVETAAVTDTPPPAPALPPAALASPSPSVPPPAPSATAAPAPSAIFQPPPAAPSLGQFAVEEAPLPAPAPPPLAAAAKAPAAVPRTNIRPNNERPAPVVRREPLPAETAAPRGRNPVLGFLTDSVNGAARSVDGALSHVLRRRS